MASEQNNYANDGFLEYLYVLDSSYHNKAIIDTFSDFLWTERYYGYGEFEITMPVNMEVVKNCRINDYISIRESNKIMVVETIGTHTDTENGDTLIISGRSLESFLEHRVILDELIPAGSFQNAVRIMVTNAIITPSDYNRRIDGFTFKNSTDPKILSLTTTEIEERGVDLYDKIVEMCRDRGIGFRVNASQNGGFEFELYSGVDRSWDQTSNIPVVFSNSYENLLNSDYLQSEKDHISTVYVEWSWRFTLEYQVVTEVGDGEIEYSTASDTYDGTEVTEVYRNVNKSGIRRREGYIQEGSQFDFGTFQLEAFDYATLISLIDEAARKVTEKGKEYLADYVITELFEGDTNPFRQFIYGQDYALGDIVQLENRYGQTGKCRITEIVYSRDTSGPNMMPTFETIEDS